MKISAKVIALFAVSFGIVACGSGTATEEEGSDEGAATIRDPRDQWLVKCKPAGEAPFKKYLDSQPSDAQAAGICGDGVSFELKAPRADWIIVCDVDKSRKPMATEPTPADLKTACPDDYTQVTCSNGRRIEAMRVAQQQKKTSKVCPGDTIVHCPQNPTGRRVILAKEEGLTPEKRAALCQACASDPTGTCTDEGPTTDDPPSTEAPPGY